MKVARFADQAREFGGHPAVATSAMDRAIQTEVAEALALESSETERRQEESAAEGGDSSDEQLTLVFSAAGVAHEILAGPPSVPLGQSMTFCGRRSGLGRGEAKLSARSSLPKSYNPLLDAKSWDLKTLRITKVLKINSAD